MPSRNRRDKQQEGLQGIQWSTLPNNPLRIQELPLASRRLSPPSTRLSTHPPISPRQPLGGSLCDRYAPTLHQDPRLLRVPSRDRQHQGPAIVPSSTTGSRLSAWWGSLYGQVESRIKRQARSVPRLRPQGFSPSPSPAHPRLVTQSPPPHWTKHRPEPQDTARSDNGAARTQVARRPGSKRGRTTGQRARGDYMHMALLRVRDGPISIARVRPVQAEPLGELLTSAEIGPSRTLSNAICIFSHDINLEVAGVFVCPFSYLSQVRWKAFFFHLRMGCISTMPWGYLFISSIFPPKIFISRQLQPPPPQYSHGGLVTCWMLPRLFPNVNTA